MEQIRVRFHVMVSDAGDWSVEQATIEAYFPVWNGILDKLGIQVVWDGTVLPHVNEGLFEIAGNAEVNALFGLERDPEAIDIYFVHSLLSLNNNTWTNLCGMASNLGPWGISGFGAMVLKCLD